MFYSVMKYLPGPQQQAFKDLKGLEDFVTKKVEQNQCTLDPNSPRDFIDSFLIRMQEVHPNSQCRELQSQAEGNQAGMGRTEARSNHSPHNILTIPSIITMAAPSTEPLPMGRTCVCQP